MVDLLAAGAALIGWRFDADIDAAKERIGQGSRVVDTSCGPIEVQEAGDSVPLLAVHGSGGGFDQGMAFAAPLEKQGIRVIAMSRFGYLHTPMPADAFVCLLDALKIRSAGRIGWSLVGFADGDSSPGAGFCTDPFGAARVEAPDCGGLSGSDASLGRGHDAVGDRVRFSVLVRAASGAWADDRQPCSPPRLPCWRRPAPRSWCGRTAERYHHQQEAGTCCAGAHFIGFDTGGHTWLGHSDEVMAAIRELVIPADGAPAP